MSGQDRDVTVYGAGSDNRIAQPVTGERLAGHPIVRTSALDEVREAVPRVYAPHQTFVRELGSDLRLVLNAVDLGPLTVGYLRYGAEIEMVPAPLTSCYHVNVPLSGHTRSTSGRETVVSGPGLAAVFSPGEPMTILWSADCAQLALKINRRTLLEELDKILDRHVETVRFDLGMDVRTAAGRSWLAVLHLTVAELERPDSVIGSAPAGLAFTRLLTTTLLLSQPHTHSAALHRSGPPTSPRTVQRVVDLIQDDPGTPYSAGDLAAHAGVSLRALQVAFHRYVGMSPMTYLTEVRLSRVHAELASGGPTELTTSRVAHRWGFTHAGRFAADYRRRYGVAPSETLRSHR